MSALPPLPDCPWLAVEGLSWTRGGRQLLSDVSLVIQPGQMVGLLGANGSGKSSILRALIGLIDATARGVRLDGQSIALGAASLRARIGVVQQAPSIDGKLTVRENLQLGGRLYGLAGTKLTRAVDMGLADAGLADRHDERADRLSGGLRRRLELARARLHSPDGLALDEPTQGLDAGAAQAFWRRVLAAEGKPRPSVLLATHDASEAARCDWLYLIAGGTIVHGGSVASLLAEMAEDVVVLAGPDLAAIARAATSHGTTPVMLEREVHVPCQGGHLLIPKLVEQLGASLLPSVGLRRASLADVFLRLTGTSLEGTAPPPGPTPAQTRGGRAAP